MMGRGDTEIILLLLLSLSSSVSKLIMSSCVSRLDLSYRLSSLLRSLGRVCCCWRCSLPLCISLCVVNVIRSVGNCYGNDAPSSLSDRRRRLLRARRTRQIYVYPGETNNIQKQSSWMSDGILDSIPALPHSPERQSQGTLVPQSNPTLLRHICRTTNPFPRSPKVCGRGQNGYSQYSCFFLPLE